MVVEYLKQLLGNPWSAGALEGARRDFRSSRITEGQFRRQLDLMGYTEYGMDREINDQLGMMAAPTCYPAGSCRRKEVSQK